MDLYQLLMMTNARLALEIMDQDVRALFRQLPQLEDQVRNLARSPTRVRYSRGGAGQPGHRPGIVEFLCDGCDRHEHHSHWEPVRVGTYGPRTSQGRDRTLQGPRGLSGRRTIRPGAGSPAIILTWHKPDEPGAVYVKATVADLFQYVMTECIPVLLGIAQRQ